eukprot:9351991-Alexandrium_andersonii.AAC.1
MSASLVGSEMCIRDRLRATMGALYSKPYLLLSACSLPSPLRRTGASVRALGDGGPSFRSQRRATPFRRAGL